MRGADYPLRAARELKDRAVDEAARELGEATERTRHAEAAVTRARERLDAHAVETERWETGERQRGGGSAATFLAVQAYRERRRSERDALREAVTAAQAEVASRREAEREARETLAQARAEAEAVERHEERWRLERRKTAERKEEQEAEDVAQARRFHDED